MRAGAAGLGAVARVRAVHGGEGVQVLVQRGRRVATGIVKSVARVVRGDAEAQAAHVLLVTGATRARTTALRCLLPTRRLPDESGEEGWESPMASHERRGGGGGGE